MSGVCAHPKKSSDSAGSILAEGKIQVGHCVSNTWYDAGGNVIKSLPAGSKLFSKTADDILGRAVNQYVGYNLAAPTYAEAQTVVNDTRKSSHPP